jgi:hypothetical protein
VVINKSFNNNNKADSKILFLIKLIATINKESGDGNIINS